MTTWSTLRLLGGRCKFFSGGQDGLDISNRVTFSPGVLSTFIPLLLNDDDASQEKSNSFRLVTSAGWNDVLDPLMSQVSTYMWTNISLNIKIFLNKRHRQ